VPQEVEIYRGIIEACLGGQPMASIAKALNARGVPSKRNGWGYTSIRNLLTDATIVGEYAALGYTIQIPPICNRETWERIKATLAQRVTRPPETKAIGALLRGQITCAACGMPVWVLTCGKKGHPRYGCPKPSKRDIPCPDRRTMTVAEVDAQVREALLDVVRRPELFDRALVAANGHAFAPEKSAKELDAELAKLEGKEAKTLKLYNEGFLTEHLAKTELASIRAAREAVEAKKAAAPESKPPLPLKDLEAMRSRMAKAIERVTPERLKELVAVLRPAVKLGPKGLEISGRVPVRYENLAAWKKDSVPEAVPFKVTVELTVPKTPLWWKHRPAEMPAQTPRSRRARETTSR
jgi:hypothetical protein